MASSLENDFHEISTKKRTEANRKTYIEQRIKRMHETTNMPTQNKANGNAHRWSESFVTKYAFSHI